jgi:hypothetical protein
MNITYPPNTLIFFQVLYGFAQGNKGKYDFLGESLHLLYIGLVLEKRQKKPLRYNVHILHLLKFLPLKVKLFGV